MGLESEPLRGERVREEEPEEHKTILSDPAVNLVMQFLLSFLQAAFD